MEYGHEDDEHMKKIDFLCIKKTKQRITIKTHSYEKRRDHL